MDETEGNGISEMATIDEKPARRASAGNKSDSTGAKDETPREIRRRQRQWLSCEACHKMKVKCDRGQPCGRCTRADRAEKCVYEAPKKKKKRAQRASASQKEANGDEEDPSKPAQEVLVKYRKGKVRHGGRTHWALILHEFEEMRKFMHDEDGNNGMHRRLKDIKKFFPRKRLQNYPFSPSKAPQYSTREGIIATLPDRAHVVRLVDIYFGTFEKILSLFHEPTFKVALTSFYENPDSAGNGWIASLFCMLALSHHITTQSSVDSPYLSSASQVEAYLEGAQAALHLSQFMLKPTLDDLRALCIIAIGKSLDMITLNDTDTLYIYCGFIVRYAFTLGMHRDPKYAQGMPAAEAQARRKVWTTILFLDLRTSIESGMPLLIRSTDYDTAPPQDTFGVLVYEKDSGRGESTPSTYQYRLAQSIKVVADIVSVINSPSPDLKYPQVLDYDAKLRAILRDFPVLSGDELSNEPTHLFQRAALSIFIHRVLLALHQPYATDPQVWKDYPTSHYSVLQCTLAILSLQRLIYTSDSIAVPVNWLLTLYCHDFMVAALYTCVALRRDQFSSGQDGLTKEQAKQTAWDTVMGVKEIWQRSAAQSVHHYKIYLGIALLTTALKAIQQGGAPATAMRETTDSIIAEMTTRMGASSHPSIASSAANGSDLSSAGGQSSGSGGMLDFMFFDSMRIDPSFFGPGWDPVGAEYGAGWGPQAGDPDYAPPSWWTTVW